MNNFKTIFLAFAIAVFASFNQVHAADNNDLLGGKITSKAKAVTFETLEDVITENIKLSIASDDFYGLKNVFLNKKDSLKKYSLLQAKSSNVKDEYTLTDFSVDEVKQTFKAGLKHSEKPIEVEVVGKFSAQIEVPVIVSSMSKGSLIEESDLKLAKIDKARLKQQAITNPDRLVGKKLTRTLASGTTVSFKDIEEPIVVEKGKVTTLVYKLKNIELKTMAEALENGSEGQIIKFKNTSSDKVVTAMVTDKGNAIVNYSNIAELAE